MKESVHARYLKLKPAIDAFPKDERGVLYIGYYPISMNELIEIEHGLKQKLTPELQNQVGEEMATKIDEMRRELLAFKLAERKVDIDRMVELVSLGDYLETLGYHVGMDDVVDRSVPGTPSPEDLERMGLPKEEPKEGTYLLIMFDVEA